MKNIQEVIQNFQTNLTERLGVPKMTVSVFDNTSGVLYTLEEFVNQYNPEDIQKGQAHFIFSIKTHDKAIARFVLQDMINCSGIIVNSDVFVGKTLTNRGIGSLINQFCIDFCTYYGYGVLQATDKDANEYQKRIFIKNGWKQITKFKNPKTNNEVNIWMYFLSEQN